MKSIIILFLSILVLYSGCSTFNNSTSDTNELSVLIEGGDITLPYKQSNSFKALVTYTGSKPVTYKWFVYDTQAASTTEIFTFSGIPDSIGYYPIKVVVTANNLIAEDSIIATVNPLE